MFSKTLELTGLGLIAWGLAEYLSDPAGLIFAGIAVVLIGGTTDDAAVGMTLRRGYGWFRYTWHRQILRENGYSFPSLRSPQLPQGWIPCDCGGSSNCPVCEGTGFVPDPSFQENPRSPHPKIKVDPQADDLAKRLAQARKERSHVRDRTPALSRYDEYLE